MRFRVYNRLEIISIVNRLRSVSTISNWHDHSIQVNDSDALISKEIVADCVIVNTTGDGNCLFNACSLSLFGNERMAMDIRLCTVFILFEYHNYFKNFLRELNPNVSFEQIIIDTATNGEWAREIHLCALSILCYRPVFSYTNTKFSVDATPMPMTRNPIMIYFKVNHYMAILQRDANVPSGYTKPYSPLTHGLKVAITNIQLY